MNTHDKYELPPLPYIQRCDYVGGSYPIGNREDGEFVDYEDHVSVMQTYALAAIEPYAKRIAELEAERQRRGEPSGYAYRYSSHDGGTVIRFNNGAEVNGCRPIESLPYWFAPQPAASCVAHVGDKDACGAQNAKSDPQPADQNLDFKELYEQMCERCDVLDAELANYSERPAQPVSILTAEDVERQYENGIHIGSGLPRESCPCGFCYTHRYGFNKGSAQPAASAEPNTHIDDDAVDHFAAAMKDKLAQARAKGRSGWHECAPDDLSAMLREHIEKGDPRDVANFCMFLWSLGKPISPAPVAAQPSVPDGWKLVPDYKVGMCVKYGGEEYRIFARGDQPGTFDICHPTDNHRDRWLNVPPEQLEPLAPTPPADGKAQQDVDKLDSLQVAEAFNADIPVTEQEEEEWKRLEDRK